MLQFLPAQPMAVPKTAKKRPNNSMRRRVRVAASSIASALSLL